MTQAVNVPTYFEMPVGWTTIRSQNAGTKAEAFEYAKKFSQETGRVVGLLRKSRDRYAVIVKTV